MPSNAQTHSVATIQRLWPFLKPERPRMAAAAAVSLSLIAIDTLAPLMIGILSDSLLQTLASGGRTQSRWISFPFSTETLLIGLLLASVLQGWGQARRRALFGQIGENVVGRIRSTLWDKLQRLPVRYVHGKGSGRLLLRLTGDTRSIKSVVTEGVLTISQDLALALAVFTALFWLNWRIALGVTTVLPVYAIFFYRQNPRLQAASREARRRRSQLSGWLNERIAALATLKSFSRERKEARRNRELNRRLTESASRLAAVSGQFHGVALTIAGVATALVLALTAREIAAHRLTAGSLIAFLKLFDLLPPLLSRLTVANRHFQESQISVERIMSILHMRDESDAESAAALVVHQGEICGENISFHPADGAAVFDGLSFTARRGELVAFVGPNGAGKSAIIEFLLRFLAPTSGTIRIDGQDIACISPSSLRSHIGVVLPDMAIFDGTIRKNLRLGIAKDAQSVTDERLYAALADVGLKEFVESLPEGLNTLVGPRGLPLSAGRRAALALARTLITDPPIILADDVGDASDAHLTSQVAHTLRRLAREKTTLITTRRPEIAALADRIYHLKPQRMACATATTTQ
jgi:ABC-type multidrug transport system fused ATPase/permease subunit